MHSDEYLQLTLLGTGVGAWEILCDSFPSHPPPAAIRTDAASPKYSNNDTETKKVTEESFMEHEN